MREIKFRAWDNGNDIMYYSDEETDDIIWTLCDDGIFVEELTQFDSCPNGEHEQIIRYSRIEQQNIMQYTGLKDKNGKEVYEGDVIGRKGFFHRVIEHNGINMQSYMLNNSSMKWVLTKDSIDDCDEVIGNIHENPELLE